MGADRLLGVTRMLVIALVLSALAYVLVAVVVGMLPGVENPANQLSPWPKGLPQWPPVLLVLVAVALTAVSGVVVVIQGSRKRKLAQRLVAEAAGQADESLTGPASGGGLAKDQVAGLRANARAPHDVELTMNPLAADVAEALILRSTSGFATMPETDAGQVAVYRGTETLYVDTGLEDERVYFYTGFAQHRDGSWSAPSWAWTVTPRLPLHTKLMGSLRIARLVLPGARNRA